MNEGACLRCGPGDRRLGALDDAAAFQGFSLGRRPAASRRGPLVRAMATLLLLGALVSLAACGGGGPPDASPTATGVELPAGFAEEQARAALQIPNVADETHPLANLVSQKTLGEKEVRAAINEDPQFVELEALAKNAGFKPSRAGLELEYDNGMKVTAAVLDSPLGGLALAAREAGATPMYAVLHLAPDGNTVTLYNSEGTATVDLAFLKGGATGTPDAQPSCRTPHCIYAAFLWLAQSSYGPAAKAICGACISSVVALGSTTSSSAVITIPACVACVPLLAAGGISAATVCHDEPCSYCVDNTCGEPPISGEEYCVPGTAGAGATMAKTDAGYQCAGVKPGPAGVDVSESECEYRSGSTQTVRDCPYGCADPPPGETRSRDCGPPPPGTCSSDADCPAEQVKSGPTCTPNPQGAPAAWVRTEYESNRCQDNRCVAQTRTADVGCSYGCAADGRSCACLEEEVAVGDPRCVFRPDDQQWIVERDYRRDYSVPSDAGRRCLSEVVTRFEAACPGGCASDGKSCAQPLPTCDPALCVREEPAGDQRCVELPSGYIIEQPLLEYFCSPLAGGGSTCDSRTAAEVVGVCPYGCSSNGKSCAAKPPPSGVPAAPSDFVVLQHAGGTAFQWTDNSVNEDGFRIYFGGASVGWPEELIITVGPDVEEVDTDFVRSGQGVCWEVYAFNDRGESAPAWYCLPP